MCPNCGGIIGEASTENNYANVYYKLDKNKKPECTHCGAGEESEKFEGNLYLIAAIIFFVTISLAIIFQ